MEEICFNQLLNDFNILASLENLYKIIPLISYELYIEIDIAYKRMLEFSYPIG